MENDVNAQVTFSAEPTLEEVKLIQKGLDDYNNEQTQGAYDNPGIEINLALKDNAGNVVGGLNVSTMLRVMHLDVFWVAKRCRKLGYGRELVLEAERIGRERGNEGRERGAARPCAGADQGRKLRARKGQLPGRQGPPGPGRGGLAGLDGTEEHYFIKRL